MTSRQDRTWRLLGIVLTDACNLRCTYCRVARGGRRRLGWSALGAALDALLPWAADGVDITFTGGEPLLAFATLRDAVPHVEERIAPRRVRWHLMTNGLLLDDGTLDWLDAHGFFLDVSLDGVPESQFLRGPATPPYLDRLIGRIRDRHPAIFEQRLKVCATVTPPTIAYLSESVRYFLDAGIRTFELSPALGVVEWELPGIDALREQFEAVSTTLLRHFGQTGEVPLVLFRKTAAPDPRQFDWSCLVADGENPTIDVDGQIYGCLRATATYQPNTASVMRPAVQALALGTPRADALPGRMAAMRDAVVRSGAFEPPDRRYSSYRKCADCEFLGRCHICPLAGASVPEWDDIYRVPDFLCAFHQVALAHRARFPSQPTADDFISGRVPIPASSGAEGQL